MRVRIRLSLRFRGEERIPTEVLAGESRFTVNRVKSDSVISTKTSRKKRVWFDSFSWVNGSAE